MKNGPKGDSACGGFVERELARIGAALQRPQPPERYVELYAAQQALSWALDPENFATPLDTIRQGRVVAPSSTQGD
jgi:hypothetical protein